MKKFSVSDIGRERLSLLKIVESLFLPTVTAILSAFVAYIVTYHMVERPKIELEQQKADIEIFKMSQSLAPNVKGQCVFRNDLTPPPIKMDIKIRCKLTNRGAYIAQMLEPSVSTPLSSVSLNVMPVTGKIDQPGKAVRDAPIRPSDEMLYELYFTFTPDFSKLLHKPNDTLLVSMTFSTPDPIVLFVKSRFPAIGSVTELMAIQQHRYRISLRELYEKHGQDIIIER